MITEATVDVYRNERLLTTLYPRNELYTRSGQPMSIPDARSSFSEDFYILLVNWEQMSSSLATLRIYLNPLINWVWAGGLIFVIGTLIAAWPDPVADVAVVPSRRRRLVPEPAGTD
jgi:cytochrome c-type biogenesis protein CcmF